jgi:hypothetical protein
MTLPTTATTDQPPPESRGRQLILAARDAARRDLRQATDQHAAAIAALTRLEQIRRTGILTGDSFRSAAETATALADLGAHYHRQTEHADRIFAAARRQLIGRIAEMEAVLACPPATPGADDLMDLADAVGVTR